ATPLLERVDFCTHPLLRQQPRVQILEAARPDDRKAHIGEPHVALRVAIAVECRGIAEGLEWNKRMQQSVAADAPGAERTPHVVARHADRRIVLRMTTQGVYAGIDQIAGERRGV